jgi:outer membrane protein assembly factor BamB
MSTPKRTGRRAAAKLAINSPAHASANSAFLPRALRRGKQPHPLKGVSMTGVATADATANFGAVLEFTQPNGKAEIGYTPVYAPTGSAMDATGATFSVWIKTTVKTAQYLFQTANSAPDIWMQNDQITVAWAGQPAFSWASADTRPISDGEWHHVAVVFTNGVITLYKDGVATLESLQIANAPNYKVAQPVFMGGTWNGIASFIGQMWAIKIWSVTLSASQVQADLYNTYSGNTPPVTLVLYSVFNVVTNTVTNRTGNVAGTLTNADVTWDALPQKPTYAFQIPGGGGDYVDIGDLAVPAQGQVDSTAATFECWIKWVGGVTPQTILLCRGRDPSGASPRIEIDGGDKLGVYWNAPGAYSKDTTPIADGAWHHIAVVFNNNRVTFYKDGIPTNETFTLPATQTAGGDLQIGPALGSTQAFNGLVTDVRVWRVARSVGDIQSNMYATLTGTESGLVGLCNLSYFNPNDSANNGVKNQVNGSGGGLVGNAKVVDVVGPQSQQPVPQSIWTYPISGIAPLGPHISPKGLIYAENVQASNNGPAGNYLRSLDLQDHMLNWTYSVHDNSALPTPVIPASVGVGNSVAYVAAQAQNPNGSKIVELHAVDFTTGQPVWDAPATLVAQTTLTKPVEAGSIVVVGANYVDASNDVGAALFWVDTALGKTVKSYTGIGGVGNFMTDPLVQSTQLNGKTVTVAYFATSYSNNLNLVIAVNLSDGTLLWGRAPGAPINIPSGGMTIDQDRLYVTCQNGMVVAMNLSDGSIVWTKAKTNLAINSKPVIIGTAVYAGSTDGNLYAFDGATGNDLWQLNAGSAITTDLITDDGAIYFATQGNGTELPPTFFSVDAVSQGNDVLIYPVPDADTILFDQGQSNGVVYFYGKQNVYAVNMDMILHEFNVDTKLTVEDYDTSTSNPTGNDTAYRITLALNDPLKVPRVNQAVKVWASDTVYLSNRLDNSGNPIQIGPTTPLWVQTDGSGQVSLAVSAYDDGSKGGTGSTASPLVNCPAIYAWANFMMPGEAIVIYPDHEHMGNLSNVQGTSSTDIARSYAVQSTLYLNQATTYNGSKLISSGYQDSTSLTNIATTIRNTIGTRNPTSISVTSTGVGNSAPTSKYIAYPPSMPNVNYASDSTQPTTRSFMPGASPVFTMDISGTSGQATSYQTTFDPSRPSNLPAPSMSASGTSHVVIAGVGEVQAITSLKDFFNKVVKGAEKVAKMSWQFASNAVNTVIHTAESIYSLTITTLEDAVTAVVGFFKSIVADIKKMIEWLSALFDFKAIIANHTLIKSYISNAQSTGVFDQMQAWIKKEIGVLGTAESDVTNIFNTINGQGKTQTNATGSSVAGQTVQSQQGSNNNPNDAYNIGGQNNATQCKWMGHKAMENSTGVGAPAPTRPRHVYLPWIAQGSASRSPMPLSMQDRPDVGTILRAFETFFESVSDSIAKDFQDFPSQVKAAMTTLKDKFKDPKSMLGNAFTDVLAVVAVLADDMIALGIEIAKDFLTFVDTMLVQLWAFVNETVNIPFVSRLYKSLTGNDLTLLDLTTLVGAVPTTILMEVITGTKTPTALVEARARNEPLHAALDYDDQIFLGLFQFAVNAVGALLDGYTWFQNAATGTEVTEQTLANRWDATKGLCTWVLGMLVSQAWSNWGAQDYYYWLVQAIPVVYSLYGLFVSIPIVNQIDFDTFIGVVTLIFSAIWAGLWPKNYLNAPKAPVLALFSNLFSSFSSLVELAYYTQAIIGQNAAALLVAVGKGLFGGVNAILGFAAYVLTVNNPSLTSNISGPSAQTVLLEPEPTPSGLVLHPSFA